jgi:hypothetical protein
MFNVMEVEMTRKRALKDAAQDPTPARGDSNPKELKEKPKGGYGTFTIFVVFMAGLAGGMLSRRFLRLWF